ncbi:hypothetical protein ASB62_01295 [Chlorobium limicola]|uniref:Uncharacterized protein n=1 Tax=Chlorobium limicola TaxID=1092 RepID=A0A101JTM1_CHLLI|nr:hypothetical protein ASB62_01295 [Chlorobium limicola]
MTRTYLIKSRPTEPSAAFFGKPSLTVAGTAYDFHVLPYYPDAYIRHQKEKRTVESVRIL